VSFDDNYTISFPCCDWFLNIFGIYLPSKVNAV
jgi:hypothetical protein